MPELLPEECDCDDEEFDMLEGTMHCWICGTRRHLSSDQYKHHMKIEAEHQAHYDEFCEAMENAGYGMSPPPEQSDSGAPDPLDDEIPF